MAVSGSGADFDTEIITIGQGYGDKNCSKPSSFSASPKWVTGAYVGSKPTVCGGAGNDKCFSYSFELNSWQEQASLGVQLDGLASIALDENRLWLTGGRTGITYKSKTYILEGSQVSDGPDLPYATGFHCVAKVNETHSFMSGGYNANGSNANERWAFLYDWVSGQWTLAGTMVRRKHGHACAVLRDPPRVMVVGGFADSGKQKSLDTTTEILDLESMTWTQGPSTPEKLGFSGAAAIPYRDSFVLVGGDTGPFFRTIYYLNVDSMTWETLDEKLENPRQYFAGFQIPNDVCRTD